MQFFFTQRNNLHQSNIALFNDQISQRASRFNDDHRRHSPHHPPFDERPHREALNLPINGQLEPSQIKTAYRRLAQKTHPDVGGSHELFVRITEARNALLGRATR